MNSSPDPSELLEAAAAELERAAAHARTAARHFRDGESARMGAHALAARGHVLGASERLDRHAREFARRSVP